jgi:predicted acylesterase/phospholipase RssA
MNGAESPRHGIVLSGGGANGAYEVGVLKALLSGQSPVTQGRPLVPDICAGTSVGSFNAAFLVSELDTYGPAAGGNLEAVWLERLAQDRQFGTNGIFRLRANPASFLDPLGYVPNPFQPFLEAARDGAYLLWDGVNRAVNVFTNSETSLQQRLTELFNLASFISVAPLQQTIDEVINFRRIRQAETKLRIPATNWTTGEMTVFTNVEMTDRIGPLAILASSAIPGVFPPVLIGAEPHVDGSVLINTPLRLVTRNAEVLHVVYLDPDIKKIPLGALESTLGAVYRQQTIAWAKLVNDDIADAAAINQVLEVFSRLKRGETIPDAFLDALPVGLSKVWNRLLQAREQIGGPYRQLTIHRYHPRDDLAGGPAGLLNLERDHIAELIERGFEDAVHHDCQTAGCVLPGTAL